MTGHVSIDRETFQKILGNAFEVQQSGMDPQSLSALRDASGSLTGGDADLNRAMHLITQCAREVANANGVAIALLEADQLVYRAATGSAAAYVGHQLTAVLGMPPRDAAQREILRVENTQTDSRIEAAVCRQFGAGSLLILPILRECSLAGVLEVRFSEAHTFRDQEVRAYRLMTGLVEELILHDAQLRKERLVKQTITVPPAGEQIRPSRQDFQGNPRCVSGLRGSTWLGQVSRAVVETPRARKLAILWCSLKLRVPTYSLKRSFREPLRWELGAAAAIMMVVLASWFTISHRVASPAVGSGLPLPTTALRRAASHQAAVSETEHSAATSSGFRRVRVGPNEIDYVADDVTIRRFVRSSAPVQSPVQNKLVNIGNDVTVRYFAYKAAAMQSAGPGSLPGLK